MNEIVPAASQFAMSAENLLRHHYSDVHAMRDALAGWQIDYRQLELGKFAGDILQISSQDVCLTSAAYSRKLVHAGATPHDYTAFGLAKSGNGNVRMSGYNCGDSTIAVFKQDQQFEGSTPADVYLYNFSVRDEVLEELSEKAGIDAQDVLSGTHNRLINCDPSWVSAMRNRIFQVCDTVEANADFLHSRRLVLELRHQLPLMFLTALSLPNNIADRVTSRTRLLALDKVCSYIHQNLDRELMIEELCVIAGVSWRTLNYAFCEYFDVTPKRFVMAMRLDRVQRELHECGKSTKISAIANHWGFWHMGQFAADYRAQFGELPSATIKRVHGN